MRQREPSNTTWLLLGSALALAGILGVKLAFSQGAPGSNTVAQVKLPLSIVANLPSCNAGSEGLSWGVIDATTPTSLSTVVGGGAVHVPVYCNNTNWIVQ